MTIIDKTGASEQEFRARIARFEADDAERVETVARAIGQHVFGLLDSFGQPNYTARKVAAAAIAALAPSPACTSEHCDRACEDLIAERDRVEDIADQLAYAIAPVEVIGEHSSANNPWQNALDILRERPAPSPAEEAVKRVAALCSEVVAWALSPNATVTVSSVRTALASPAPAPHGDVVCPPECGEHPWLNQ